METESQELPPQSQEKQPGVEHEMEPRRPQAIHPDYKPANKLHGKVALVTGGDSGIGKAVCYCFAREGAAVALSYVKEQEENDAMYTLKMILEGKASDARDLIAIPADVRYDENCQIVADEVVNNYGKIDILMNDAAEQYLSNSIVRIT